MTRPIKFRAWNGKKMLYPNTVNVGNGNYLIIDGEGWSIHNDSGEKKCILDGRKEGSILMQFTGLKDKNGKEIYEGDIISVTDDKFPMMVVKWLQYKMTAGFATEHNGQKDSELWLPEQKHAGRSWEIIGNIYKNPELLK